MQEELFKIKFLCNVLKKNSVKSKAKEKQFLKKINKSVAVGDMDSAKIYAHQSVQHKALSQKFLSLACRMELLEANIQMQIQTNQMSVDTINVVGQLSMICNPTMTIENILQFEQVFDNMVVAANTVNDTVDGALTVNSTTAEEEELINCAVDLAAADQSRMPSVMLPDISKKIGSPEKRELF